MRDKLEGMHLTATDFHQKVYNNLVPLLSTKSVDLVMAPGVYSFNFWNAGGT